MIWLAVAVGGALGSMARHGVNMLLLARPRARRAVRDRRRESGRIGGRSACWRRCSRPAGCRCRTRLRTFVFVGILGGFTTFSSFMLDTFTLGHGGDHALAFWNVALQTAFGLLAVWAGYRVGRRRSAEQ